MGQTQKRRYGQLRRYAIIRARLYRCYSTSTIGSDQALSHLVEDVLTRLDEVLWEICVGLEWNRRLEV